MNTRVKSSQVARALEVPHTHRPWRTGQTQGDWKNTHLSVSPVHVDSVKLNTQRLVLNRAVCKQGRRLHKHHPHHPLFAHGLFYPGTTVSTCWLIICERVTMFTTFSGEQNRTPLEFTWVFLFFLPLSNDIQFGFYYLFIVEHNGWTYQLW